MPEIAEYLRRQNREIAKLEGSHAAEFLRMLQNTKDSLVGRLDGVARSSDPLDVWRLRAVIAETDAGIRQLTARVVGNYGGIAKDAADLSIDHLGEEMAKVGVQSADFSIDALKVLSDPMQGLLADQYAASVERYGSNLLQGVRQRLFSSMRAGDSFGDVVKGISAQSGPMGIVGRDNAERLVRTEVSQAYGSAHQSGLEQVAEEVPNVRKRWVHIGSYPCDYCESLDGTVRKMSGSWTVKMGKRTRTVTHPPLHPNCVCRLVISRKKRE